MNDFSPASTEADLIRAAQHGDLNAFGLLIERHHATVRATLAVRMNFSTEVDDLAQETFLTAFRKLPTLDPNMMLASWLRGVALNLLLNYRRKFRADPIGDNIELQELIDRRIGMDFREGHEDNKLFALKECLEELDGPARALIQERYSENATIDEIAARLKRKASAISMQLFRLRSILATCIDRRLQRTP